MTCVTLEQAIQLILEQAKPINDIIKVPVLEANGHILAEDLIAPIDNPPFDRAPVDGYTLWAEDTKGASYETPAIAKVAGCIYAGDMAEYAVERGQAVRIMTGAAIPKGCSCTVMQEDTDYGKEQVAIYKAYDSFQNYCFCGEDYKKGTKLLEKGSKITFAEQGILASAGVQDAIVFRKPHITLITTGDELNEPQNPLLPGKIYDSNRFLLMGRFQELGFSSITGKHVGDDVSLMAKALQEACACSDFVLTTGGVSVGEKDILHDALKEMGASRIFWKVQMKPGTPTIFSVCQNKMIISLSGNPFGALANFELLIRPALAKMSRDVSLAMREKTAVMAEDFPKASKRRRFVRAVERDGIVSLPKGILSSGAIASFIGCNCLIDIEEGTPAIQKGEKVRIWML